MLIEVTVKEYHNLLKLQEHTGVNIRSIRSSRKGFVDIDIDVEELLKLYTNVADLYTKYMGEMDRLSNFEHDLTANIWTSQNGTVRLLEDMATQHLLNAINLLVREHDEEDLRASTLFKELAIEYLLRERE